MAKEKRTFKPRKERVTLNERMLPDVKDLQIGEETTIEIKVKVVAISEGREWGGLDEDEGGYEEREYGKEYAEAKRKEDSLKRATFVILSADEDDGDDDKPNAQKVADRIMAEKRRKRVV